MRPGEILQEHDEQPELRPDAEHGAVEHDVQREKQKIIRQRAQPAPRPELLKAKRAAAKFADQNAADQKAAQYEEQLDAEKRQAVPDVELARERQEEEARMADQDQQNRRCPPGVQAETPHAVGFATQRDVRKIFWRGLHAAQVGSG